MNRTSIVSLALSAAALVGLALNEGYTDRAVQPLPGDKWTVGFGSTERADGQPVQAGDKTSPPAALAAQLRTVQRFEGAIKQCVHVPLAQNEYDAYVRLAYNIGPANFCGSTLVHKLNAQDYDGACREILRWDRFQGAPSKGLAARRQQEYRLCVGEVAS